MGEFILFILGLCFGAVLMCCYDIFDDNMEVNQIIERLTHERDVLIKRHEALKKLSDDYAKNLNDKNKKIAELENLLVLMATK